MGMSGDYAAAIAAGSTMVRIGTALFGPAPAADAVPERTVNAAAKMAFLGGGNMAWALIQGLLRHGVAASQLRVGEPLETQRVKLQAEFGVLAVADNAVAVRDATPGGAGRQTPAGS